jgi:ribosomal protein S18 acetylase RimI-like enzyme
MTASSARGKGIGGLMCGHSLLEAAALGFRAMQFNIVVATNTTAVALWQKHGFRIIGTTPGAFRHETPGYVDAHIMFRELGV